MWRSAVQVCLGLHFAGRQCDPKADAGRLGLYFAVRRVTQAHAFSLVVSGGLAQLARAPALQAGGQRFESVILHMFILLFYDWTISQFDNCRIVNREIVK